RTLTSTVVALPIWSPTAAVGRFARRRTYTAAKAANINIIASEITVRRPNKAEVISKRYLRGVSLRALLSGHLPDEIPDVLAGEHHVDRLRQLFKTFHGRLQRGEPHSKSDVKS